jgi:hypothetical protein
MALFSGNEAAANQMFLNVAPVRLHVHVGIQLYHLDYLGG